MTPISSLKRWTLRLRKCSTSAVESTSRPLLSVAETNTRCGRTIKRDCQEVSGTTNLVFTTSKSDELTTTPGRVLLASEPTAGSNSTHHISARVGSLIDELYVCASPSVPFFPFFEF